MKMSFPPLLAAAIFVGGIAWAQSVGAQGMGTKVEAGPGGVSAQTTVPGAAAGGSAGPGGSAATAGPSDTTGPATTGPATTDPASEPQGQSSGADYRRNSGETGVGAQATPGGTTSRTYNGPRDKTGRAAAPPGGAAGTSGASAGPGGGVSSSATSGPGGSRSETNVR